MIIVTVLFIKKILKTKLPTILWRGVKALYFTNTQSVHDYDEKQMVVV